MPSNRSASDARRARTQELAATLYDAHRRRLLAIATRNSLTLDDAEEALHDTFAIFIDRFDPDSDAPPLAWLTLTLKRRCWACYRHLQPTRPFQPPDQSAKNPHPASHPRLPEDLLEVTETVTDMRRSLAALKPDERKALTLLALGYSYKEIAERNQWTYTKVNRCINEGRAAIRNRQAEPNRNGPP